MKWAPAFARRGLSGWLALVAVLISSSLAVIPSSQASASVPVATQVSSGGRTTCAVMSDHSAYCWGDNTYGQLGDGDTNSSPTPKLVSGGLSWASISTRAQQNTAPPNLADTCGITTSGDAYCWGANSFGNVGDTTTTPRLVPTAVSGGLKWLSISVGVFETCGVTTGNAGYCWGRNSSGGVGDNTLIQRTSPSPVFGGLSWASISGGDGFSCGVTTGNTPYCWGTNWGGQLGDGTETQEKVPTAVSGLSNIASLSAGADDVCAITTLGAGYCWGYNSYGMDGNGNQIEQDSPVSISGGYTWASISQGHETTCGITTGQVTYCWGRNADGEVGDATNTSPRTTPTAVSTSQVFASVSVGPDWTTNSSDDTSCGLTTGGVVYCWGWNGVFQIGDGTTNNQNVPTRAMVLFGLTANTTYSVTITPTFTFTVANQSSACNGESNFVSGAGSANAVALGNLAAGSNVSGGQALTVAGNSGGGFAIYVAGTQASQNLRSGIHNWTDVSGTYASPAALGAGERFGYTYHDASASSSVTNPGSANFIALTNTNAAVIGSNSSPTGSGCVSYDAQTSASTPAASYSATIIYTAVPTF